MNKKLIHLVSRLLVAVCLCVNFTACGDDDDLNDDISITGTDNGHAYVDLGLPSGLKWAVCNVGAVNPWDYGDYFAWGETVGYGKEDPSNVHNYAYTGNASYVKTYYDWNTYKYCSGNNPITLTKYNDDSSSGSVVDNKAVLDPVDDAAHVNMGGNWRMPTTEEIKELIDNCYWEWTDNYKGKGVKGDIVYKVKNPSDKGKLKNDVGVVYTIDGNLNGRNERSTIAGSYSLSDTHIFLPAAGRCGSAGVQHFGGGQYWLSVLTFPPYRACTLMSGPVVFLDPNHGSRQLGLSVRGVVK